MSRTPYGRSPHGSPPHKFCLSCTAEEPRHPSRGGTEADAAQLQAAWAPARASRSLLGWATREPTDADQHEHEGIPLAEVLKTFEGFNDAELRNQICLANRNRISPKLLELPGLLTVRALAVLARNRVFADEGTELNHATALYVLLALEERIGARSDEFLNSSGNG